uniref:Uncharacterized protein n=1 Tax=Opuntia streptacantha TaxID=393608 RepID=A0A7C9EC96_OPUST
MSLTQETSRSLFLLSPIPHLPSPCLFLRSLMSLSLPFPQIFALGKRFGLVPESHRTFARPRAEVIAGHGVCPYSRLRVATASVFGCRPSSNYSVSTWPSSHGLRPRVICIRSKVRVAIWLEVVIFHSRTFASHGKGVLGGCFFPGSCEVWPSISLIFWLSLFLGDLTMLFWWYVCLCCWWNFLFAMTLSCSPLSVLNLTVTMNLLVCGGCLYCRPVLLYISLHSLLWLIFWF